MTQTVAFIGLGLTGTGMAENLVRAGHQVTVYNRTAEKSKPLVALGAKSAASAAEAVTPGQILISMLADDRAVEEVVAGGAGDKLGRDGLHISMSTISPETSRRLQAWHHARGSQYLTAPVFGRPNAAAAAKLWVMQSGSAAAKSRAKPLFDAMSQGVYDFGTDAGAANVVKLCGNFLIANVIESLAESFTLAQKNGIDRKAIADFFTNTILTAPVYQSYGAIVAAQHADQVGFELKLGFKDVKLITDCAERAGVPMPIASVLRDRFVSAIAKGREQMDWTAIALGVSEDAGLKP